MARVRPAGWLLGAGALVLLYALPWLVDTVRTRMAVEILYFGLFAVSFNLLFGYGGLLSFGHAATFGVGGYTLGLLLKAWPAMPFLVALAGAALAGALAGFVIGLFCVRLRGTYFALLTLAFSQFLFAVAFKWRAVTRGDDGLIVRTSDMVVPGVGTLALGEPATFYVLELTVVLLCLAAAWRFTRTPLGAAVVLMRENDERAAFLGYNAFLTKLIVSRWPPPWPRWRGRSSRPSSGSSPRPPSTSPWAPSSSSWPCSGAPAPSSVPSSAAPSTPSSRTGSRRPRRTGSSSSGSASCS